MIEQITASQSQISAMLEGLGDAALLRPIRPDGWSARDIVAHLAGWYELAAARLALIVRGEQERVAPIDEAEVDGINAALHARDAGRSVDEVREQYASAGARVRELLAAMSDELWQAQQSPVPIARWLPAFSYEHDDEHAPELVQISRQ
jgi:hypothetical protein